MRIWEPPERSYLPAGVPVQVAARLTALRRRYFAALFLEGFLSSAVWFLLAAGFLVLVIRTAVPGLVTTTYWAWLALPLSLAVAWVTALARRPSARTILTLSDLLGNGGGLLLAVIDTKDETWAPAVPSDMHAFPLPRIRVPKSAVPAVAAFLFLSVSYLVPQREPPAPGSRFLAHEIAVSLENQLDLVEDAALGEEEREELREALTKLREEMEKRVDAASLESASEVATRMAEGLLEKEHALRQAERDLNSIRKALEATGPSADPAKKTEAGSERDKPGGQTPNLAEKLKAAAEHLNRKGVSLELGRESRELLEQLINGAADRALTSDELRQLAESLASACKNLRGELSQCTARLCELVEGGTCLGYGEKAAMLLEEAKKGGGGTAELGRKGTGKRPGNLPGKGAVTRGPADAPMFWGKEVRADGFKPAIAPPTAIFQTDKDVTFETFAEPEVGPETGEGSGGVRAQGPATGVPYEEQKLPPRRRKAVKKFFSQGAAP